MPTVHVEPTNTPVPTPYVVPPATGGITVDGSLTETAWTGSTIALANPAFGESHGVTATLKVRWDATYYYLGLEVAEPASLRYASPTANIWDTNAVEIFLDMNHSGKSTNLQAGGFPVHRRPERPHALRAPQAHPGRQVRHQGHRRPLERGSGHPLGPPGQEAGQGAEHRL